ncbi:MAG: hypothetical protein JXA25_15720 [Anaerolineales bacterium]|nr:hypothetical protein [Anaerolineales bacterium]
MQRKPLLFLLASCMFLLFACAPAPASSADLPRTLTPMSAAIQETVTARALEASSGDDNLATAVSNATQQAEWIYATQTVRASLNEPSRLATATAIAPVVAEMPLYGIDPGDGYVAWIHDPVTLELVGYQQADNASDYPAVTAADFVVVSDITWNTFNSIAGCGFLFRSDGDAVRPTQYTILMERIASGQITFTASVKGELSNYHKRYPKNEDPSFDWANDATNRLALVVRGNLIDIYTNGIYIGQVDITREPPPRSSEAESEAISELSADQQSRLEHQAEEEEENVDRVSAELNEASQNFVKNQPFFYDGFLAFLAVSDTGRATCTFENAWLFILAD